MKSNLKLLVLIFPLNFFYFLQSSAQFEIGFGAGASIFQGDLGGTLHNGAYKFWDLNYQSIRGMGQVFVRMPINKNVRTKINYAFASIAGSDAYAGNPEIYERGIRMNGNVSQISGNIDFSLYKKFKLYGMVGIGYSFYNPTISQNGVSSVLSGSNYQNSCFTIPIGIGGKIADVGKHGKLEFEVVAHFVNSDWVDGVAGPNSYSNDTYTFASLNYSIVIGGTKENPHRYAHPKQILISKNTHCPEF